MLPPFPTTPLSISLCFAAAATSLLFIRFLRFRRIHRLARLLGYDGLSQDELYEKMTLADAQLIQATMGQLEFPKLFVTSLQFALFRTYAIPSISRLLQKTRQLSTNEYSAKRYSDTVVLIAQFVQYPLDSELGSMGLARVNYLHSLYPSIVPSDILFTLVLFAIQPVRFIDRFEWRKVTDMEKVALWKYWFEVGVRMKIPSETIPGTLEDMMAWSEQYEEKYMVPDESNNLVGMRTVKLLLYWAPAWAKEFAEQLIYAVLDERLRTAMIFPKPPAYAYRIVDVVMGLRQTLLRYVFLPRLSPKLQLSEPDPKTGRLYAAQYDVEPYYVPERHKWGFWGLVAKLGGWPIPGESFRSQGFYAWEVGPSKFEKSGRDETIQEADEIRGMSCPF